MWDERGTCWWEGAWRCVWAEGGREFEGEIGFLVEGYLSQKGFMVSVDGMRGYIERDT